jgi:hypothetical protein
VICKDAGDSNDDPFEAPVVAEMIKALGPRLRALGLPTKVPYPECHDADTCWRFIQAARDDEGLWAYVGMVGYHLYGGEAVNTHRPEIRQFALAKGLPTGHAGSDGINLAALADDLTLGGVSCWSIGGLGGPGGGGGNFQIHLDNTSFSRGGQPPGSAVRLESPDQGRCKVTSITRPGDLVVRFEASDGTSTVGEELTVLVHPINVAPVIDAAQATPATVAPSDGTTLLSAVTRDPDVRGLDGYFRDYSKAARQAGASGVFFHSICRLAKLAPREQAEAISGIKNVASPGAVGDQ